MRMLGQELGQELGQFRGWTTDARTGARHFRGGNSARFRLAKAFQGRGERMLEAEQSSSGAQKGISEAAKAPASRAKGQFRRTAGHKAEARKTDAQGGAAAIQERKMARASGSQRQIKGEAGQSRGANGAHNRLAIPPRKAFQRRKRRWFQLTSIHKGRWASGG